MKRSTMPMKAVRSVSALSALALVFACSSSGTNEGAAGAAPVGSAGAHSAGAAGSPVVSAGAGGAPQSVAGAPGATAGAPSGGASAGSAGASAGAPSVGGSGGSGGSGGMTSAAGNGSVAGAAGAAGGSVGTGGAGSFDPCPASEPCKILPLGDSITWGINYGGGYRIKLFTHTSTDNKKITFLGYDTANPPTSAALSALGSASSMWVGKHEGHSGWTIQQDDDLVTGKSTASNDSVNYTGKKVVADFSPHIVLIHLGTNDMYQTPAGAPDRLGTLIDHVVADAPNALVVVSSIIPFPSGASAVDTFNKAVPGVVKKRADAGKHVLYVDMFAALTKSDLGSDMVHPNEGGYEKMAVVWYNAIKPYLH
ncbi:MAG TPA: SGNH/GDSL hydrolase family protein [Polyangiaceae bacterium]|nr:SGNH/GDSL hydrolase family protein [Polyangiaceae bacterium]